MTKKEKLINFYKEALEKNPEAKLLMQYSYLDIDHDIISAGELISGIEQLNLFIKNEDLDDELKNNYFYGARILLINDVIEVEV